MKKFVAIVVSVCLVLGVCVSAFAASDRSVLRSVLRGDNRALGAVIPSSAIQTVDSEKAGENSLAEFISALSGNKANKKATQDDGEWLYTLLGLLDDEDEDEDEDEDWEEYFEDFDYEDLVELYELLYFLFENFEPAEILELIAGLAELSAEEEEAEEEYDLEALLSLLAA